MPRLSILSLGTPHINLDDAPVTGFNSVKAQALLIYLAVESQQAHSRESLAGLLWPEYPERHARHTLSQVLSNVRQIIGDRDADQTNPFLHVTRQTIGFNRASDYWLDTEVLDTVPQTADAQQTITCCEQAVDVYRGHFLEGFSIGDSSAFEEWILIQRERWQRVAMETLTKLVAGYVDLRNYDNALRCAWRQLDLDPWREDGHRQVMRLLALSGQRTAALAQYETCRQTLREELDVEPEAETTALYEAIKTGTPAPSPTPYLPRASTQTPLHNLPAQLTPLVGRDAELASLRACLQNPACRLLTLVGPGGIGKTRLALDAVRPLVPNFDHGVFFVPLAPLQSAQAIVPAIAKTLSFTFSDKGGPQKQQLLAYLRNKTMLLVLDNAEHLLSPHSDPSDEREPETEHDLEIATTITQILEAAPDVKILVTSRARVNALGEHLYPVQGLAYPEQDHDQLEAVIDSAAVQLFVQSARRLRPDFTLSENNIQAVCAICRCVEGVPLAILLSATWTATLSTAEVAVRLTGESADLGLLETDWRNVPPRHRSLRVVFEHSWHLLTEHEQRVMQALAVFRGGFTPDAARTVADAKPHDLRALVNASFLRRESSGRYTIHELLRQFAAGKLAQDHIALRNAHDQHCAYFVKALQRWGEDSKGPRQRDVLVEMDAAIDNARAAWDWAVAQGNIVRIDRAILGLGLFYRRRLRRQEGEAACRAAVERLEAMENPTAPLTSERLRVLSKMLTWHSRFLTREQAYPVMKRNLALLERLEQTSPDVAHSVMAEKAAALRQMGLVMLSENREEAREFYEQSLRLYQTLNISWEESHVLNNLGWLAWHTADFKAAQHYQEQGLVIARSLGDLRGIIRSIGGLSGIAMLLGRVEEGARLAKEFLALAREMGDLLEIGNALYSLGFKYISLGRAIDAIPLLEESKSLTCDQLGLPGGYVTSVLAYTRMMMGHYKQAYPLGHTALRIVQETNDQHGIGWTYHVLGGVALGLAEFEEAEELLRASVRTYRPLGQRLELTFALSYLSFALWAQGQFSEVKPIIVEVIAIWNDIESPQSLMFALVGMALLSLTQNMPEHAVERYALAATLSPTLENCRWFWDVAGRHIDTATASLPSEVVEAAQARGRALDVQATVKELLAELEA